MINWIFRSHWQLVGLAATASRRQQQIAIAVMRSGRLPAAMLVGLWRRWLAIGAITLLGSLKAWQRSFTEVIQTYRLA